MLNTTDYNIKSMVVESMGLSSSNSKYIDSPSQEEENIKKRIFKINIYSKVYMVFINIKIR
jgi:hypothetical protein